MASESSPRPPVPGMVPEGLAREVELASGNPGRKFGRYVILSELGQGGMGAVYRAWDPSMSRLVALKVLLPRPDTDPAVLGRFQREARAAARLNHPAIVDVYDVGERDGKPYIVMAFIPGITFRECVKRGIGLERIAAHCARVARGLDYAHGEGVVHRDVKPSNILLDLEERSFLTDFGLAQDSSEDDAGKQGKLTALGETLGTPLYMSPEQARGVPGTIGPAADIYSLGTVLYWACTGKTPFDAPSTVELFVKVISDRPPRPSSIRGEIPATLDEIILRAIAKDPRDRFASAAELATSLEDTFGLRPSSGVIQALPRRPSSSGAIRASSTGSGRLRREPGSSSASGRRRRTSSRSSGRHAPTNESDRLGGSSVTPRRTPALIPVVAVAVAGLAIGVFFGIGRRRGPREHGAEARSPSEIAAASTLHLDDDGPRVTNAAAVRVSGRVEASDDAGASLREIWAGTERIAVGDDGRFDELVTVAGEEGELIRLPISVAEGEGALGLISVTIDRTPPVVELDAPTDRGPVPVRAGAPYRVAGRVRDAHAATLTIDPGGVDVAVAGDGAFSAEIDAFDAASADGARASVVVTARDAGGNEAAHAIELVRDASPPAIAVTTRTLVTNRTEVQIQGRVEDPHPGAITVDGEASAPLVAGTFAVDVALGEEGTRTVTLAATDAVGHRSPPVVITIEIDRTPPTIVITTPADGMSTRAERLTVRGRIEDAHPPSRVRLQPGTRSVPVAPDGSFEGEVTLLGDGATAIVVRASDAAGNEVEASRTVRRDTKAPTLVLDDAPPVRVVGPSKRRLALAGTTDPGCTLTIAGAAVDVSSGGRFATTVTLEEGENAIELVVRDKLGNEGRLAHVVHWTRRAKEPPKAAKPIVPAQTWWRPTKAQLDASAETRLPVWFEHAETGLRFVLVPGGTFTMGSPKTEKGRGDDETPFTVTISEPYFLGATEVTNEAFRLFRAQHVRNEAHGKILHGAKHPITSVSWDDARAFCVWLERSMPEIDFDLPTEAQWENAARLGGGALPLEAQPREVARRANVRDLTAKRSWRPIDWDATIAALEVADGHDVVAAVGALPADALGLFEVLGNVSEWCRDYKANYPSGAATDPEGPATGTSRVHRGGSWSSDLFECRPAARQQAAPGGRGLNDLGFRVVARRASR